MMRFMFKKGLRFQNGARILTIERRLMNGSLQLEAEDGEIINASETEILVGCTQGSWRINPEDQADGPIIESKIRRDLASFPVVVQEGACRRQDYLNRLLIEEDELVSTHDALKKRIIAIAEEIGDQTPPSPISVYRWYRRYRRTRSVVDLTDRHEAKGRKITWSNEVIAVIDESIDQVYLNQQKHPGKAVYDEVCRKLLALQRRNPDKIDIYRIPSRPTVYRYLNKLERYAVDAARLGRPAANRKFRAVLGIQKTDSILERWEIDHTPLDLIVYDEETRLPHGRPWLTAILDKDSRMIMGIYISFGNPSAYSVLQCLRQAILPKDELLKQYQDITLAWPARGIPEVIVCDNGMELHSDSLIKACQELNIQIQFCPSKLPEYKGAIERFFRTIAKDLIHRLPGATFSNIWERGDYPSENLACIGFKTLLALLYKWIVEVYHQEVHRGIGVPPALMWEKGERERLIEYPANPKQLWIITAHTAERTLFRYGLEINGLKYNCPELQSLYRRHGSNLKLSLKYHEDDISYVHVFDPDEKVYLKVPAIDQEYSVGLTLDQHDLIRQALRNEAKDYMDRTLILEKKRQLQAMIDAAVAHKKMGVRKKAAKLRKIDSVTPDGLTSKSTALPKPAPQPVLAVIADQDLPAFSVSKNTLYGNHD